jgi:hypothetical protein
MERISLFISIRMAGPYLFNVSCMPSKAGYSPPSISIFIKSTLSIVFSWKYKSSDIESTACLQENSFK